MIPALLLAPALSLAGQGVEPAGKPPAPLDGSRTVSWKSLFPNILSDQKQIWLFPLRSNRSNHWIPAAAVVGATASLTAFDPRQARYFRRSSSFKGFNNVFNADVTTIGTIAAPASLYGIGLLTKDRKMRETALLAGQAAVSVEILTSVMKVTSRRRRPVDEPLGGDFSGTWFHSKGSVLRRNGSFPSGHTMGAFAVATVIARRYRNHRWVPYLAYAGAALVGLSRVSSSSHFISDVFVGGALGYSISRFAVLRQ